MIKFQLVLPTIEVDDVDGDFRLENLAESIRRAPETFFIDVDGLTGTKVQMTLDLFLSDGAELVVKRDEGLFLVPQVGTKEYRIAKYVGTYLVESSNGKSYITDDYDVRDGYFQAVPVALFTPHRGEKIENPYD